MLLCYIKAEFSKENLFVTNVRVYICIKLKKYTKA
ncbi:hypothetical protein M2480_002303 [Parabacteroides sp. PFB2-12]|nr:hypothetical protein [Parabacteroides sp. PM6-13]MDH6391308.1 hypothetical protein [Parabacteroides sp. PFB2-12]